MMSRRASIAFALRLALTLGLPLSLAPVSAQEASPSVTDPAAYTPVVVPSGATLPFRIVDGVKVFHLVAEPVDHEFAPGLKAACWGYNGRTPGPVIEAVEGDRVRIYVSNKLPEPTSVHWHGILLPNGMDGIAGLNQKSIEPGETYRYEFTLKQHGTFMYHPHFDEMVQIGLGMAGLFVIHPREPENPKVDRDFAFMIAEWKVPAGTSRPDPAEMTEFNTLTINSKCFPGTAPLVAKQGDRVRLRIGNLSVMDHHPIHLHGYNFKVTGTDGGEIPPAGQWPETTVLVPVGSTRDVQFVADAPGDWALHCHMVHHLMNQMGHGLPNLIGIPDDAVQQFDEKMRHLLPGYMTMGHQGMGGMAEMGMRVPSNSIPMVGGEGPYGYIDMGGMFTILKVRENLTTYEDPGWYEIPAGTQARPATPDEIKRDGIPVPTNAAPTP
ncbi:MAG: copper oxidase [Kiritimatiellae bacterium]|nr:copper oxidase [Kiritimatiellia bacterium]